MSEEPGSLYKRIELIGVSSASWEDAVKSIVEKASTTLRDLRIAEVDQFDVKIENGKVAAYRVRVKLSFKYEKE
ncbi:MAG: dodecin domain-containing protein [Candidatus Thorarchaeota archaeon]|nr:MAG: dodecin domain-containing protein [Candidatus Thorarchaeota archaeon]